MSEALARAEGKPRADWYVYILRCADDTLYTGITTDPERRLAEHNGRGGAKYTRVRQPVELVYLEESENRSLASQREWQIKQLPRKKKQVLCEVYAIRS